MVANQGVSLRDIPKSSKVKNMTFVFFRKFDTSVPNFTCTAKTRKQHYRSSFLLPYFESGLSKTDFETKRKNAIIKIDRFHKMYFFKVYLDTVLN
jgi:hypothetical protein